MGYFDTLLSKKEKERKLPFTNLFVFRTKAEVYKSGIYLFDLLFDFPVISYGHV